MLALQQLDLTGYNRMVAGLHNALIGSGQDGDLALFVQSETRQLAAEISNELKSPTLEKAGKKITRDLKKLFHPMENRNTSEKWNIFFGRQAAGQNGLRWLYAGPTYLVGIDPADYFPQGNARALEQIYNQHGRATAFRGAAWHDLGPKIEGLVFRGKRYLPSHGQQHVKKLNRIAVLPSAFWELQRRILKRTGRLAATFAFAAHKLGWTGAPGWVTKHFTDVEADGAAIFDTSKLSNPARPEITFGSRAPGVQSNPYITAKIQNALKKRQFMMVKKLRQVLSGYTYDFNNGRVFKSQRALIAANSP